MTVNRITYRTLLALLFCCFQITGISVYAQQTAARKDSIVNIPQAKKHRIESNKSHQALSTADSLDMVNKKNMKEVTSPLSVTAPTDSLSLQKQKPQFIPNPGRATWLAAVFPGAGQIYNRKYWKLPIIYGGLVACTYALSFNNKYYKDYSKAYVDLTDGNSKTTSYLNFLSPNYDITGKEDWLKKVFKQKKDSYRRYRDMSIFSFIGVYLVSIIDAYVDAELSSFDISPDIGMRINPAVINDNHSLGNNALGVQCSIKF